MSNKNIKVIEKKVKSLKIQNKTQKMFFKLVSRTDIFETFVALCECNEFWKFFKNGTQLTNFAAF